MRSIGDENEPQSSNAPWLPDFQQPVLKSTPKEHGGFPQYLLPERSLIETQLNKLYTSYDIPLDEQEQLDDLVFAYNSAVETAFLAVARWERVRGDEEWDPHAMLYLEQSELVAVIECMEELLAASKVLMGLLQSFEPLKKSDIPYFLSFLNKFKRK
jgi:hypothetical protein